MGSSFVNTIMSAKPSKISAQSRAKHEAYVQERWTAFAQHIEREQAAGNTRLAKALELFPDSTSYGWRFIDAFQMFAIIPLASDDHSYFALKGHGVAFLADYTGVPLDKRFIFDSEHTYLSGAASKPKDAYHAHIEANPVVLFFYGNDDGHVGLRFASKQAAAEFIDVLDSFDDVFDFDKNPKALHKAIMSAETVDEQKEVLATTLCYHN